MSRLFEYGDKAFWPVKQNDPLADGLCFPGPPHVDYFGSAEVELADGTRKAPDQGLLDTTPGGPKRLKGWPTVVFEMAWTQTSKELAVVCGRWVAASEAKVNLAVGIDVILKNEKGDGKSGQDKKGKNKKGKNKKGKNKEAEVEGGEDECEDELEDAEAEKEEAKNEKAKGNLKKRKEREEENKEIAQLWVTLWEVVDAEPLMKTSGPIKDLLRADGEQEDPLTLTDVPPATKFTFISPFSYFPEQIAAIGMERFERFERSNNMAPPKYVKYYAAETQRFQVCPFIICIHCVQSDNAQVFPPARNLPTNLEILLKHLYRDGNYEREHSGKPAYLLPLMPLLQCIRRGVSRDQGAIPKKKKLKTQDDNASSANQDGIAGPSKRNRTNW
jgi:hypothetical protein